jgi:hypothetical protein
LGSLVLALTFVLVALPGATLILLPLLKLGAPGFRAARPLLYFAGLGLGFMLLEIALIQRFILFWGHPLYAAASVIGTLLTGMGLGSLYSSRLDDLAAARRIILVVVLGFLLALPWLAPVLTRTALAWPFPWRIGATVLLLLPPAFLLGMPMPLGLRAIRKINSAWVPWAWGINGCFSVAGAVLAAWLAVVFGFSTVLAAAAISYTVALLAVPVLPR